MMFAVFTAKSAITWKEKWANLFQYVQMESQRRTKKI